MKTLVMLGIMLSVAGPVLAQTEAPAPNAAPNATNAPAGESRLEQRITQMHQRLKITPQQQSAWDAFAQVMRDNAASTEQAYRQRAASIETMSAVDNLRNFAQLQETQAQNVQKLATSFDTLYAQLSDEQKKTADAMVRHFEAREGRSHEPKKPG